MLVQLSPQQARVIGALLEKETTTPEQYPLSLNSLTLACNQKSNRDPVMQLSETQVQEVIDELNAMHLLMEEPSSRVTKYKHRFCNTEFSSLQFTSQQRALICLLLLRGPQTPGELRSRSGRLAEFENVSQVEDCLQSLFELNGEAIVVRLARQPGKRESRYAHLFSGKPDEEHFSSTTSINEKSGESSFDVQTSNSFNQSELLARVNTLEAQVKALNEKVDELTKLISE